MKCERWLRDNVTQPGHRIQRLNGRPHRIGQTRTVTVYRLDPATAAAEVVQVQPVRGAFPRNINLAPGAGWLLAAGADSNTVAVHKVNPQTGVLTYQTKGVINVPAPICIVFVQP